MCVSPVWWVVIVLRALGVAIIVACCGSLTTPVLRLSESDTWSKLPEGAGSSGVVTHYQQNVAEATRAGVLRLHAAQVSGAAIRASVADASLLRGWECSRSSSSISKPKLGHCQPLTSHRQPLPHGGARFHLPSAQPRRWRVDSRPRYARAECSPYLLYRAERERHAGFLLAMVPPREMSLPPPAAVAVATGG